MRRKPLVLSSTKFLVDSILKSSPLCDGEALTVNARPDDDVSRSLLLPAGILRLSNDRIGYSDSKLASYDDSVLVGLSTSVLKRLSITSGSLVSLTNLCESSVSIQSFR